MNKLFLFIFSLYLLTGCCSQQPNTPEELFALDASLNVEAINADTLHFKNAWLLQFEQPIDHKHPEKGTFKQRIWYSHSSNEAPTVMITEGYSATRNYTSELTKLTNANQLIVEHRYFDQSVPDNPEWQYLTIEQAANDHHRIIEFFKQLYSGKWATTGISKGGQTSLFHRAFFPNDVDVSVPYVAPLNLDREDQRLFDFFKKVGSEEERQRIMNFQKNVLYQRGAILPLFETYAAEKGYTFRMGVEKAFELVVLEYPFSLWQWGASIDAIPSSDATPEELFKHLRQGSDIGYVSDQDWERIKPFFYQAYKELGYYAYVPGDLKPLLSSFDQDTISSCMFAPGGDTLKFESKAMPWVMQQIKKNDPKIIAIVGGQDPWGATSINPEGLQNTLKAIDPKGSHKTRIKTLPSSIQKEVTNRLKDWLTSN